MQPLLSVGDESMQASWEMNVSMLSQLDDNEELAPAYRDDVGFGVGCRRERHIIAFALTLMVYGIVVAYYSGLCPWLEEMPHEFRAVFVIVYGMYMLENLGSKTSGYLWRLNGDDDARGYVKYILDTPPHVRWIMHCYHHTNPLATDDAYVVPSMLLPQGSPTLGLLAPPAPPAHPRVCLAPAFSAATAAALTARPRGPGGLPLIFLIFFWLTPRGFLGRYLAQTETPGPKSGR